MADREQATGDGEPATHRFDKHYWEQHWARAPSGTPRTMDGNPPNPYLMGEARGLVPGTALDAGCGAGAEAIWLAAQGWRVTAADIAPDALARAARRASDSGVSERIEWVEADLGVWDPGMRFDLVTTNYAHPAMGQLPFYDRVAGWVAVGGTLLIVGHLHAPDLAGPHGDQPPAAASAALADITGRLDGSTWRIDTAGEHVRTLTGPGGPAHVLRDVVVRATRVR